MTEIWTQAALWMGLALVATLVAIWLRVATALSEIVIGTVAQLIIGAALGSALLAADASWLKFLAGAGAILLTFLAGAELDPVVFRKQWKQATLIGLVSFAAPFLGCAAIARWVLGWTTDASWLAGIAMSTTSVAVVYAVMLEFGLNTTHYGKIVLAACFVTDLATVVGLGLIFAPFTVKTVIFLGAGVVAFVILPWLTPRFFKRFGNRPSELEAKYLMFCPVRPRRTRDLGRKRGGAAGVLDRHGTRRHCWQGSRTRSAAADAHLRTPCPILFHSRRLARLPAGARCGSRCVSHSTDGQDGDEDSRRVPGDACTALTSSGRHVHHLAHVYRAHLRNHLCALWLVASDSDASAVLRARRRGGGKRSRSDTYRQRVLSAPSPSGTEGRD